LILFISPHLDDIALSCGGYVRQLASRGAQVTIATVCTADRPVGQPLSDTAAFVHGEWQLGDDQPYAFRRAEDVRACAVLGATPIHLDLLDAIYRHDDGPSVQPLYARSAAPDSGRRNFIGGDVHPHDWRYFALRVKQALQVPMCDAEHVYCPLGIGGHVDHVIVRGAVEALAIASHLTYYEDYPYADKLDWRDSDVTAGLAPTLVHLGEAEIAARIDAIACYASQQVALFKPAETMPTRVRNYIAAAGGERYWTRG